MGLDLYLYTARSHDSSVETWRELAYGRKTWAIADFFSVRSEALDSDVYYEVPESAWDEFIDYLRPYLENEDFREMIFNFDEDSDAPGMSWEIEVLIEQFLDRALDNEGLYTLGAPWEARAVIRWYEANEKVKRVYEGGGKVFLLKSY